MSLKKKVKKIEDAIYPKGEQIIIIAHEKEYDGFVVALGEHRGRFRVGEPIEVHHGVPGDPAEDERPDRWRHVISARDLPVSAPTAIHDRPPEPGQDTPATIARREGFQEIQRKAGLEVPPHLLKGLTDLRVHLGFDRDGREEVLRDAVRMTLVGTRRLNRLSVRLDLDLNSKE